MSNEHTGGLAYLLDKARQVTMTPEEVAEQRRSFAYGNAAFENSKITKEMIASEDLKLNAKG